GHLEDLAPQVQRFQVVLPGQETACLIVQVAAEQITETTVNEPEHDAMSIDRMGSRMSLCYERFVAYRLVPDRGSVRWIPEELQADRVAIVILHGERPQNFDPHPIGIGETVERIVHAELEALEIDRAEPCIFLERIP